MKSMQRQLIFALLIGILLLAGIVGTSLYAFVRQELTEQFDSALGARARVVAASVHLTRDGVELAAPAEILAEFSRQRHPQYFEIWNPDGSVFARSLSMVNGDLPTHTVTNRPAFADLEIPDRNGQEVHIGRAVFLRFRPQPADEDDALPPDSPRIVPDMTMAVAQSRSAIDEPLDVVLWSLVGAAVLMAVGVVLVVAFTVRRSLRPLAAVADEASRINVDSLEHRFAYAQLPAELQPICQRLNDLLERLNGAFKRERRFTSDVAHELRTPIAELRSLAEVAIRWPGDAVSAKTGFRDALEISRHMERMVTALLALARCESGRQTVALASVDLHKIVGDAWQPLEAKSTARNLRIDFQVPSPALVLCDPALLSSIVSNLLSNAVQYATADTAIVCAARRVEGNMILSVSNQTTGLANADLQYLFEPFWRKDAARSPDEHSGLGLALVKGYADALHAKVEVALSEANVFSISIGLPIAAQNSQAAIPQQAAPWSTAPVATIASPGAAS